MVARGVDGSVLLDEIVELVAGEGREYFLEADIEVIADEAFEVSVIERRGDVRCEYLLNCAADVMGGIEESAVYVEEVDRELGNGQIASQTGSLPRIQIRQAEGFLRRSGRAGGGQWIPAGLPAGCRGRRCRVSHRSGGAFRRRR